MKTKYLQEILAMSLIGDGLLTALDTERHLKLWRTGPDPFSRLLDTFLRHPRLTRVAGVAAVVGGVWWASRQKPDRPGKVVRLLRTALPGTTRG